MGAKTEPPKIEEKKPQIVKETIPCKYTFTDTERLELGQKLALTNQKIAQIEDEKKRVASDYKAKQDSAQADANSVSTLITNGYEMRPTECIVEFKPKEAIKIYRNAKTGAEEDRRNMLPMDFQIQFPNWGKETKAVEPAAAAKK